MGCTHSLSNSQLETQQTNMPKPTNPAPGKINHQPATLKTSGQSGTRARRLSYVTPENSGQAPEAGDMGGSVTSKKSDKSGKSGQSTRSRRLSYVTTDANGIGNGGGGGQPVIAALDRLSVEEDVQIGTQIDKGFQDVCLWISAISRAGREPGFRKQNQDNCFAFEKYLRDDVALLGAFDGHGPNGHQVSTTLKQHLPVLLARYMQSKTVDEALKQSFLEIDSHVHNGSIDCQFSGSTATVAIVEGTTVHTAWVGDSRGVLGSVVNGSITATDLTDDHKPTLELEKERIIKAGGRVERMIDYNGEEIGPPRVWLQFAWVPGLAMSRAIGDTIAQQAGVSSEPQIRQIQLKQDDRFMILASDGVWEFISSQEAVEMVHAASNPEEACRKLIHEANERWVENEDGVVDDITAVIAFFKPGKKHSKSKH